jgi:hypothetical protein
MHFLTVPDHWPTSDGSYESHPGQGDSTRASVASPISTGELTFGLRNDAGIAIRGSGIYWKDVGCVNVCKHLRGHNASNASNTTPISTSREQGTRSNALQGLHDYSIGMSYSSRREL